MEQLDLDKLNYEQKSALHNKVFSLGALFSHELNDKLILISLVALVTQQMRKKDKNITPLKVLMSITQQKEDNTAFYQFLESLSILVDDLCYGSDKIDPCGFKTSQEIINKIKEILSTWLPF